MAARKGKENETRNQNGFVEEPDFGDMPEAGETHESVAKSYDDERILRFMEENPEFALKAQGLSETPEDLKTEIVKQEIVMARQEESRNNGVWAKLNSEPKLFAYYNNKFKNIADGPERKHAICEEFYRSLRIEGNYINPRFYDRSVSDEQVKVHLERNPQRMKELDKLQAEGQLTMAYARNEFNMTTGERAARRKVEQFLSTHEPDRKKIESMSDEALRNSVIRDTYFKVSRREAVNAIVTEWLDRSPAVKARLEKEHSGKEPEYRRNSILKDAAEAYRKATGKAPRGEKIEFDEESVQRHVDTHPDVFTPIMEMSRDELIARDVQRRRSGSARAWEASPKVALFSEMLQKLEPDLHKRIVSNARFQQEPFRTQKIAKDLLTKGEELVVTNPQAAQQARGMSR